MIFWFNITRRVAAYNISGFSFCQWASWWTDSLWRNCHVINEIITKILFAKGINRNHYDESESGKLRTSNRFHLTMPKSYNTRLTEPSILTTKYLIDTISNHCFGQHPNEISMYTIWSEQTHCDLVMSYGDRDLDQYWVMICYLTAPSDHLIRCIMSFKMIL